jgi:tRNA threonylcarbamoyladenosine biosynthesis protein TsaB
MKIFVIELSSRRGSLALLDEGVVMAEKHWEEDFRNRQQLFDALKSMHIDWDEIDCFAAGRGPGAFSGMRIGFSVINSLAAPARKPVYALNSGAAIAAQTGAVRSVVVGDARRSKVWAGVFSGSELEKDFQLLEHDELAGFVPADARVVSPDHDRLRELLAGFTVPEGGVPVYPMAGQLGQLIFRRMKAGRASEPLEPLYMHPPVFVKPRFHT